VGCSMWGAGSEVWGVRCSMCGTESGVEYSCTPNVVQNEP
jgi:hypothetical protein